MIGGRYVKGEQIRINYEAYRLTTGLSDVTISIIRSDGNKEIDSGSMTELNSTNAPGIYYYDWTPTKPGTMTIYCDSVSKPKTYVDILKVDGRGSKYTQVMGVHGGMSRVTVNDTWTEIEKQRFLDETKSISESHKKSVDAMSTLVNSIETLDKRMKYIETNVGDKIMESQRMSQNIFGEVAGKINRLDTKNQDTSSKVLLSNDSTNTLNKNLMSSVKDKIEIINDKIKAVDNLISENKVLKSEVVVLNTGVKSLRGEVSNVGKFLSDNFYLKADEMNRKIKDQQVVIQTLSEFNSKAIKELNENPSQTSSIEKRFLITPKIQNINTPISHKIVFLQDLKKGVEEASQMNDSKGAIIRRLDAPFKQVEYLKE